MALLVFVMWSECPSASQNLTDGNEGILVYPIPTLHRKSTNNVCVLRVDDKILSPTWAKGVTFPYKGNYNKPAPTTNRDVELHDGIAGHSNPKYVPKVNELIKDSNIRIDKSRLEKATWNKAEFQKFEKDFRTCRLLEKNGFDIKILFEAENDSGCDIMLNGIKTELKSVNGASNIHNHANKAVSKQGAKEIVFELGGWGHDYEWELEKLTAKGIHGYYFIKGQDKLYRY